MKKQYTKPFVAVELFGLTQSIALGCSTDLPGEPTHRDRATCGWRDPVGDTLWDTAEKCNPEGDMVTALQPTDAPFNGMCYNNPDGGLVIFNS